MEGQHFQYSVVEFDEESLILYDPESSLEGDEMGAFTEKCLQDNSSKYEEIHDEFDVESLILFDPESSLEVDEMETEECSQEQNPGDEYDYEELIIYDPDDSERDFGMCDSVLSKAESVSNDLQGPIPVIDTVESLVERNTLVESVDESDAVSVEALDECENEESGTVDENVFEGRARPGRKRKVPTQTRLDRKRLLNNNKTHINSKGDLYEEKIFNTNFECGCLNNCTNVVPLDSRRRCFTQFWTAGTFEARAIYLITCLLQIPTLWKKEAKEDEAEVTNRNDRDYAIFGTPVCQRAILGTLQIDECRFKTAIQKYMEEDSIKDNRGKKSGGWNALPPTKTAEVRTHIASFPKYVSHYTRAKTESKYLGPGLNLSKLYELYKAKHEEPVSRSFYKNIFYTNFNLKFKHPKKDTCLKCDQYAVKKKTSVGADLRITEELHETHLLRAESLSKQMKADCAAAKLDDELETLTFDMQKTLPIPKLSTSIAYYKRQLNLYNLGIHSGSDGKGKFNLWIESEASKGTQEVGSCLKQHIESIEKPIKKLILWSDSCGGQNRSIKLVLMMMYILENHPTLQTISMRYLLSGHSFLPNDTEFASAETSLKQHDYIFTDEQYMDVMKECRIKNKFDVNRMSSDDFFSVKKLESLITNRKFDINKAKVSWLDTHEIVIHKNQPGILQMKKEIGGAFQTVNINKIGGQLNFGNLVLDSLWPMGKAISAEKLKDLQDMLQLIPSEHQHFYEFLNTAKTADFIDDIDGFGDTIDFDPAYEEYLIED